MSALEIPKESTVKKKLKKLTIHRETLLSLDRLHLQLAEGGATVDCTYTNCCSGLPSCATCGGQCGSRLC